MSAIPQGDLGLLETETAQQLLSSSIPARMAFVWTDGTPRITPTWFHWDGAEIVMATYLAGPNAGIKHAAHRVEVLRQNPAVTLVIDTEDSPPQSLTVRGRAVVEEVDGLAPEYVLAAQRYLGAEAAAGFEQQMNQPGTRQARISVRPEWVGLLDFQTRLPNAQGGVH